MAKRAKIVGAFCLAAATLASSSALALEYCVTCEGPPAMYRCVVDGTPEGAGKDPTASLHCISQMATRGKHQSCAVSRGAPFPCPGLTAMVQPPKNTPPPPSYATDAPDDAHQLAPVDVNTSPAPVAPPKAEPAKVPRTVEELANQTMKSSQEGLKQAGDAIGGTAKKAGEAIGGTAAKAGEQIGNAGSAIGNAATTTWNCITSLFSSCSSQPPSEDTVPAHEDEAGPTAAAGDYPAN